MPFTNSLGMKFVPVLVSGMVKESPRILFSVWETRNQDYAACDNGVNRVDQEWKKKSGAGPLHPVVNVSAFDAMHFCLLLSRKDMRKYRLPTDHEWSCAVGIGDKEHANASPDDKKRKLDGVYPWGGPFPPGPRDGNYGLLENQSEKTARLPLGIKAEAGGSPRRP